VTLNEFELTSKQVLYLVVSFVSGSFSPAYNFEIQFMPEFGAA
jgi:hypothetical protein